MANEIYVDYASGNTAYAVIRNRVGHVWCTADQAFEDWDTNGHAAENYHIPLIDKGGSRYVGDFDPNVPVGHYRVQIFVQTGSHPADGDAVVAGRDILWTGAAELTSLKILANKAVQNRAARTVEYYDDDGETVLLTHALHDDASTTTRTCN